MAKHTRSRFNRAAKKPQISLTERDYTILGYVHQFRLLGSNHIVQLMKDVSSQMVARRLRDLFHAGLLDRPHAQKRYFQKAVNRPLVYAISSKGASALKKAGLIDKNPGHWTHKNSQLKELFLEHRLGISDFFVRLLSERSDEKTIYLEPELRTELLSGGCADKNFRWRITPSGEYRCRSLGVIPDGVFAVECGVTGKRIYYFLEYDRGTMPVRRHSFEQTSFYRKLVAYYASWRQHVPEKLFSWPRYRILTITSSQARCDGLVKLARSMNRGRGSGLFLFTTVESIIATDSLLDCPLQVGRAGAVSFLSDI